jgi:hypothetical protein
MMRFGHSGVDPEHLASSWQGPLEAEQTKSESLKDLALHDTSVPEQKTSDSQGPMDEWHSVLEFLNALRGQIGLIPVQ